MRTSDWSAIAASSPINADAARAYVYGYEGEEPVLLLAAAKPVPKPSPQSPTFRNLIGTKKEWLTVVAYGGSGSNGARWIVRCICGRYEFRSTKAMRPTNPCGRCDECHNLQRLQQREKERSPTP